MNPLLEEKENIMSCTIILVGKKVSLNGGNIIGRNDESGGHGFTPKKFVVIHPQDQPKIYESTINHCKVSSPDKAYAYCACPSASEKREFRQLVE